MLLYHGSTHLFKTLKSGSFVTPYLQDALSFGVPWDSSELSENNSERPPFPIQLGSDVVLEDGPLYLYRVDKNANVVKTLSNTGKPYQWNFKVLEETNVSLVAEFKAWKKLHEIL